MTQSDERAGKRANKQDYQSDFHESHGVLPPFAQQMKVDVMLNKKGGMTILHDRPVTKPIEWLEYDRETGLFTFLYEDGTVQNLGLELPDHVRNGPVLKSGQAGLMYVKDGRPQDLYLVPIMIRGEAGS